MDVRPSTYNASFYILANAARSNSTLTGIDVSLRSNLTNQTWASSTIPVSINETISTFDYVQLSAQIQNTVMAPNSNNTFAITMNASEVAGTTFVSPPSLSPFLLADSTSTSVWHPSLVRHTRTERTDFVKILPKPSKTSIPLSCAFPAVTTSRVSASTSAGSGTRQSALSATARAVWETGDTSTRTAWVCLNSSNGPKTWRLSASWLFTPDSLLTFMARWVPLTRKT